MRSYCYILRHRAQEETYDMDTSYAGSKPVRTTNPRQYEAIVKTPSATATNQCKFCKNIMSAEGLSYHQVEAVLFVILLLHVF